MNRRLVWNDLKANKMLSFFTCFFMALSAFLFALTVFLSANLLSSIDGLMRQAKTPDFLQMHTGELKEDEITEFAENHKNIESFQIAHFLNIDNTLIELNGISLSDSTQDNGVCVQNGGFDFLLDLNNEQIQVKNGEIYAPVCYRQQYGLQIGDEAQLGFANFRIAGFLRDSQMNSMMASSKRFLISRKDYEEMRDSEQEEYLIEFLLEKGADVNQVEAEYTEAGLPANGPAITRPLILMVNALSGGLMILIVLLISVVMLAISLLCVRYMVLTKLETDKPEAGMLKAIGISHREICRMYFVKYLVLSVLGAGIGLLAAYLGKQPMEQGMKELYGMAENESLAFAAAVAGVVLVESGILLSISQLMRRLRRISAVEALTGRDHQKKNLSLSAKYLLLILVIGAGTFLMTVPGNLCNTISSPQFVTYMGIGGADIRLDVRQTDGMREKTQLIREMLQSDTEVMKYTSLQTKGYYAQSRDSLAANLNVELGDHTVFPVSYIEGRAPAAEDEISLSSLCAKEFQVNLGDRLTLLSEDVKRDLVITGIYSDITNGGKTAKASFTDEKTPSMWSIFYMTLNDQASESRWIAGMEEKLSQEQINAKVIDVPDYVNSVFGPTVKQVKAASVVALCISILVVWTVVFLFLRLELATTRLDLTFYKAIGFTTGELQNKYFHKYLLIGITGVALGIGAGNLLGEKLAGILLRSLGADGIHFVINGFSIYLLIPMMVLLATETAVLIGVRQIKEMKPFECCTGRE